MEMTTNSLVTDTYLLLKQDKDFLKFEKPVEYFQVTSKTITNFITQEKTPFSKESFETIFNQDWHIQLLDYELGFLFQWDELPFQDETRLATFINFKTVDSLGLSDDGEFATGKLISSQFKDEYIDDFKKTYEYLLSGDCYQLNLTRQIELKVDNPELIEKSFQYRSIFPKLSEFAHLINLPAQDCLILSNSPECLFEYDKDNRRLITRPIKGTIRKELGVEALKNDIKNESELNIITDLLRHDLSAISEEFSTVDSKREFFEVPGLIHQYSKISVKQESLDIPRILRAVFPGGSITGAPKKRVLALIQEIEKRRRGIYTGSTVFNYSGICKASINIRSLTVQKNTGIAHYGSGGGITLLSDESSEFEELLDKTNSFLKVFFLDVKV